MQPALTTTVHCTSPNGRNVSRWLAIVSKKKGPAPPCEPSPLQAGRALPYCFPLTKSQRVVTTTVTFCSPTTTGVSGAASAMAR